MSTETCKKCGQRLIEIVPNELYRCPVCLLYHHIRAKPKEISTLQSIPQSQSELSTETFDLTRDQNIFINRLAEQLAPLTGLTGNNLKNALKIQERYRLELRNVFLGKQDFNTWFDMKRTERGLHTSTLAKMIYDSLDGLTSPEARNLRQQYADAISRLRVT